MDENVSGCIELPAGDLNATVVKWGQGRTLHRVHDKQFGPVVFNPDASHNARFSPLRDSSGVIIPTLYAGTTLDCALMETIFHDVPFAVGFKPVEKRRLVGKMHSELALTGDLHWIDLSTISLKRLGLARTQLIDTEKNCYPRTRAWAEAMCLQFPKAQGLRWTSRQDDRAQAFVIFGTRVDESALTVSAAPVPLIAAEEIHEAVIDLAQRLDVDLV